VKWSEVKWVTVKFLGTKVQCTLGWPYIEGTWLYCDCFIWCVSCTVVVLTGFVMCVCVCVCVCVCEYVCGFCNVWVCVCTGFVMCVCVYVWVFWQLCGCFGTICTCIYYLLYYSWFQTFAVFCMLYAFFWVIPQCLSFICRRFGTLCLFHLHRQVGMKNSCETSAYKIQTPGCFVLFVLRFCIVSFMYIYSYLFCLYWCKDGPLPPSENSIVVSQ